MRGVVFIISVILVLAQTTLARAYTDAELIDGFNKTVFGSEYARLLSPTYVRKFNGPVRFYVKSTAGRPAQVRVQSFKSRLDNLIAGLRVRQVKRERDANFVVHVVPRRR